MSIARKPADTSVDIHPVLAERWCLRAFESNVKLGTEDLTAILEAGRWAPSSNNGQPWRFMIAHNGDTAFSKPAELLSGFNKSWAPKASVLITLLVRTTNDDGTPRPLGLYDLGLAGAMMTIEAHHRGFAVHQIAGFDREAFTTKFDLPSDLSPAIILAIGKQAGVEALTEDVLVERESAARSRLPLTELVLPTH
jgi:nitroreductase